MTEPKTTEEAPGDPAAYALLFDAAVRALDAQAGTIDELRTRVGTLLSAAGVVAAFLGGVALGDQSGLDGWSIVAVLLLIISTGLLVWVLWPRTWDLRLGVQDTLEKYIEGQNPATMSVIHRSLAWHLEVAHAKNERQLEQLYRVFTCASALFVADAVVWLVDLMTRSAA